MILLNKCAYITLETKIIIIKIPSQTFTTLNIHKDKDSIYTVLLFVTTNFPKAFPYGC